MSQRKQRLDRVFKDVLPVEDRDDLADNTRLEHTFFLIHRGNSFVGTASRLQEHRPRLFPRSPRNRDAAWTLQGDDAALLQIREGPADRFGGDAQHVGDVVARDGQHETVILAR